MGRKITESDYVERYSSTWNTRTIIAPALGVTLVYDNSRLQAYLRFTQQRMEQFFCAQIADAVNRREGCHA